MLLLLLLLPVVRLGRCAAHDVHVVGRLSRSLHVRRTAVIGAMLHLVLAGRRAILLRRLILLHLGGTTPASLFASFAIAVAAMLLARPRCLLVWSWLVRLLPTGRRIRGGCSRIGWSGVVRRRRRRSAVVVCGV